MSIEALMKAVPPPAEPLMVFDGPWAPIEAELGVVLPQDYKDFTRLYGFGLFLEFLAVHSPIAKSRHARLVERAREICDDLRDEEGPYSLWPEPGGLLPFGRTDNGDYLCWVTRGAPSDWVVAVWSRGFYTFEEFNCDLTGFLAGLATGEIRPDDLDELLPCEGAIFAPSLA